MIGFDAHGMLAPAFLPDAFVAPERIATLRLASAGFVSAPSDTPALAFYEPRILEDIEIGQSAADALAVGGRVALTVSEIAVADGDNFSTDLARYGVADGRAVRLLSLPVLNARASDFGTSHSAASLPFTGILRGVERGGDFRARLALGDVTERMATPLQPVLFQGTGGQEGGNELKGRPKPVTLGQMFNVAPVFLGNVDLGAGSLPTYQSHWREIAGHDAIRIRGVAQVIVSEGTPLVGQARDYPALGLFQLGAAPDGDVTADLRGDTVPIYVNSIAGILRRMTARYLRVDLTDGAAPYMDIGLLAAGQLWRLQRGTAYGIREGRVMLDRRDRNPYTGAEFSVPAIVNPRMAAFTLPALSTAEARNQHREMLRRLGAARDTLWIAELGDSLAEQNRRAIWGAMNAPGEDAAISRDSLPLASRGFRVVERV